MSSPQRKDAPPMVGSADTKDAPPTVGSADTRGATIPPPDTRRSYT
jgi:hypothetical protein